MDAGEAHLQNTKVEQNPDGVKKLNNIWSKLEEILKANMFDYKMKISPDIMSLTKAYVLLEIEGLSATGNEYELFKEVINQVSDIDINTLTTGVTEITLGVDNVYKEI